MEIKVSVHDWLALPMPVRIKLRQLFNIPRSQGSLVEGNIVKSDGTTFKDLEAITVEKMQGYLGTEVLGEPEYSDFVILFNATVDKIQEEDKELEPPDKPDPVAIILEEWTAKLGQMMSQAATLELTEHLKLIINKLFPYHDSHNKPAPRAEAQTASEGKPRKTKQQATAKGSVKATGAG